jgi:hypothetical protein
VVGAGLEGLSVCASGAANGSAVPGPVDERVGGHRGHVDAILLGAQPLPSD